MNKAVCSLPLLAFLAFASGCASEKFRYEPQQQEVATNDAAKPAVYSVIAPSGQGQVEVATLGVSDNPTEPNGPKAPMLRVRMTVSNGTDGKPLPSKAPWHVSTRDQKVTLSDGQVLHPAYADSVTNDLPELTVAPGQKQTFVLFYPLPEKMKEEKKLPGFTFDWTVRTPGQMLTASTTFDRIKLVPMDYGPYAGMYPWGTSYDSRWIGSPWWP